MTTYEEWRVTGSLDGKPYEFAWSPMRNSDFSDPERRARDFLDLLDKGRREFGLQTQLTLQRRTVTVTEWEDAS